MVEKVCPDCGGKFSYMPNPNFPDKRKYCDVCGAKRKEAWEASQGAPAATPPVAQPSAVQYSKHDVVINRTEKPHSYEFGKAGSRHKVYYNDVSELLAHVEELKKAQLFAEVVFEAE